MIIYAILTTQIPRQVCIALPKVTHRPPENGAIQFIFLTDKQYKIGIEEKIIGGIRFSVYDPEKTVVDCFKFRSKVGVDLAVEALKESKKLWHLTLRLFHDYKKYGGFRFQQAFENQQNIGRGFNEILVYYGMERFLARLSQSKFKSQFVLKGALALHVLKSDLARATRDIDFFSV